MHEKLETRLDEDPSFSFADFGRRKLLDDIFTFEHSFHLQKIIILSYDDLWNTFISRK